MTTPRWFTCTIPWVAMAMSIALMPPLRSQEKLEQGKSQDLENSRSAEEHYRSVLSKNPNSAEALTGLGISLSMQGRSTEAIAAFSKALGVKQDKTAYALLARERCQQNDVERAKPMLVRILKQDASDAKILSIVSTCYLQADSPMDAIRVFSILTESPDYRSDHNLIELTRSYIAAAAYFGHLMNRQADAAQYAQAIQQAQAAGTTDGRGAYAFAAQHSPYFHAEATYPEALSTWQAHPSDTSLLYQLSVLVSEQAFETYKKCSEEFPNSPYLAQFNAEILADQNREDEALSILNDLEQQHSDLPDLWYQLGLLHLRRGDWEKASAAFRRQVAYAPQDERSASLLSSALLHLEAYEEDKALLRPRSQAPHPPIWVTLDLATAEEKTGNDKDAIALLRRAEELEPSDRGVRYRLMKLYRATGNATAAAREASAFQKLAAKTNP